MYDMIIVGSGPAGLAAAIYAARAGLDALTLEKNFMSGGQVVNTYQVDNYPGMPGTSGMDLAMAMRNHAEALGAHFEIAEVTGYDLSGTVKKVMTADATYETKTVVLALGAHHRLLGVPGEEEFAGQGVSYCATCDGAFFKGSDVAVIGGGDVAVEDAIFLARGCRHVYVIHRRDQLRAAKSLQDAMFRLDNVEVIWDSVTEEITGQDGQTGAVRMKNVKTGAERIIHVDGVFIAVGIQPETAGLPEEIRLDPAGYIVAGEDGRTSVPGVYAVGDMRTKALRQIITACADGANAVNSAQSDLAKAR